MSENLQGIIDHFKAGKTSLIGLLQDMSTEYGYIPADKLEEVSDKTGVPISRLYSLCTFYASLRLEPMGEHYCAVCVGTACHVRGATKVVEEVERQLGIKAGETTKDGKFTLETVNCLGACALGPLVVIDEDYHGKMDARKVSRMLKQYMD
jgi:NADH-quinone oxidoreductase subunit E